ncbi:hypothetical protein [Saccharothrix xinjiangensis]|uniref:DUF3560 domain-containing protein n=1 Tax=Saccharothrix xinjiangensis TaxID=204798 RepID=A0ABV9XWR3_9PSEU
MPRTQVHPDVPLEHAWQEGRRIWVRTPKDSQLNRELIELGSTWDWAERARWVGTVKRAAVTALLLADEQREQEKRDADRRQIEAGHWVQLSRDVEGVVTATHQLATELGAVWDGEHWRYALPDDVTRGRLQRALDAWLARRQADRDRSEAERRDRHRAQQEEQARQKADALQAEAERTERRRAQVLADSGRIGTGETVTERRYDERYMNRAGAEQVAWQVGTVHRLRDGRHGLVVDRHIRFYSEDQATEYSHEVQLPDNAHWAFTYTLAVVEPAAAHVEPVTR